MFMEGLCRNHITPLLHDNLPSPAFFTKACKPYLLLLAFCLVSFQVTHHNGNISGRQHLYEVGKGVRRLYKGFRDICQVFGVVSVWDRWIVNCWSLKWKSVVWHGLTQTFWSAVSTCMEHIWQVFDGVFFTCILHTLSRCFASIYRTSIYWIYWSSILFI